MKVESLLRRLAWRFVSPGIERVLFGLWSLVSAPDCRELQDLTRLRQRADAAGLRLFAIENVPTKFYDKIMLGLPGRDDGDRRARITSDGVYWMYKLPPRVPNS